MAGHCPPRRAYQLLKRFCQRPLGGPILQQAKWIIVGLGALDPQGYGDVACRVATELPPDSILLQRFGHVISAEFKQDLTKGLERLKKFFIEPAVCNIGRRARSNLSHALYAITREALLTTPGAEILYTREYLDAMRVEFGKIVLDIVCSNQFHEVEGAMHELMDGPLHPELKKMLVRRLRRDRQSLATRSGYAFLDQVQLPSP